ncbi:aminotransferase class I/II-fold pyridoxal phosphate-dependent enzyme [Pseudooceanicola sp. CBS1P-1]|uniref:Aminotransferase class I/II-fold pyridoxal phosphate-dependent enzyme n=1 Tax=Pseudooceanicola albus TaxID=2692189 RepID=A0A6L7GBK7_9RHOB|nr:MULTISPECIES: aminotransferase class I/II-fold pyridoxal phosphate-dependent enzyme [Pseudooceanicola]MBT9386690.1 aminotransferase class I/II-fold pyridoxal phosphate-dependent enzyme [Pseudooceanicola endophyticus]MXN20898.1 aminotransferase class I/II-fold pyridoxal phosphate-dependent enzyme [Pseudooceanicola albus]
MFPERFSTLPEYAFPRLRTLLDSVEPGGDVMHMTIGEPRHPFPQWVGGVLADNVAGFAKYPANDGTPELLGAISDWAGRRYGVNLDPASQIMALNGSREGLYNAGMALLPESKRGKRPVVLIPNPFYQVYMIAAISVGAEPVFVPATKETGHLPDYASLPEEILERTVAAYLCTPANPQGAVAKEDYWKDILALAEKHDFQVFADECYSEVYRDEAPLGGLTMAERLGVDPERVVLFQSLSKRSNLPGLRSGFVAGGPQTIRRIRQLRAYSGAPIPNPIQAVSARLWADEAHVEHSRALYQEKYAAAAKVFSGLPGYETPEGGFFLWLPVQDGEEAAMKLWRETGIRVLPGAYLSRDVEGTNPGAGYIRVAMVAPCEEMVAGLQRLRHCLFE